MTNFKNKTERELGSRKVDLILTIDVCNKYLQSCTNTLLGPLGAKAEIKKCMKEIDLINQELEKRHK